MSARCSLPKIAAVADFGSLGYGLRPYLERIGILAAARRPEPTLSVSDLRVNTVPLSVPLPPAAVQIHLRGQQPPDGGVSSEWPHSSL